MLALLHCLAAAWSHRLRPPPRLLSPQVLHLDRNGYYGGECASLNLTNLYKKFVKNEEPPKAFFDALGSNRDYNVDLIPKFILAGGARVPWPAMRRARC